MWGECAGTVGRPTGGGHLRQDEGARKGWYAHVLQVRLEQMEALQLASWLNNPDAGVNKHRRELMKAPQKEGEEQGTEANDEHFKRCLVQYMKKKMKKKARQDAAKRQEATNAADAEQAEEAAPAVSEQLPATVN